MTDWIFEVTCGSDQPFEVVLTDATTGNPVDLTGATAEWLINRKGTGANVIHYTEASGLTLGGVLGTISGSLLPADTIDITTKENVSCDHQMFVTLAGGRPTLIQQGVITFVRKLAGPPA